MNTTVSVNVASFLEAFNKFLSYSDGSLTVSTSASFAELKDKKRISFSNETQYWHGNHYHSSSCVELLLVEKPCLVYIVKYHYLERSDNSHLKTETSIFVPNEK